MDFSSKISSKQSSIEVKPIKFSSVRYRKPFFLLYCSVLDFNNNKLLFLAKIKYSCLIFRLDHLCLYSVHNIKNSGGSGGIAQSDKSSDVNFAI